MKNIHVILIGYRDPTIIDRAIASLQHIGSRVEGVSVLGEKEGAKKDASTYKIRFIKEIQNNLSMNLASLIQTISTEYIMLLHEGDCLTANIKRVMLNLSKHQHILGYLRKVKNVTIHYPFLVRTAFIKRTTFFSRYRLPFSEALMPAWLASIQNEGASIIEGSFITSMKNQGAASGQAIIEFIEKYQKRPAFEKQSPSLSIIMAHFNMEQYVGTSISSCLLQTSPAEEILLMDDGSTLHAYKELEKWSAHPGVKIFRKENGGKARALNDLLPQIETDFVLEIDADDWLDPDALIVIRNQLLHLSEDAVVLYGNLRTWKQKESGNLQFKGIRKGYPVRNKKELISYRFPLGPRIYRSQALKTNGFPVVEFEDGRMYEDVSVLNSLLREGNLVYKDFTVYNVREHPASITKRNRSSWNDFLKFLD
ncbi:glycosyltransferase family 2 protein [Mesobacillus foraminis]|uniref:glycosyltransferase family 2 protein n=1 Tax=Mesobacillus foraminis TaxID=279826 RepID=UPI001BE90D66|nr:glycosyltransferase family A protein [Mesobacillus foraminis]MBT2756359.1 glycosyltransferase family 2 protein [Mesobacillus foraminis]